MEIEITNTEIRDAASPSDIDDVRGLFREYQQWLQIDLCFQNFEKELAELPGDYDQPQGGLLLAFYDSELAGCVALRKLDAETCEMKRLFVRDAFRGKGIGRQLLAAIIRQAKSCGYRRLRLDTIAPKMNDAIQLYHSFGFREIAPYRHNPEPGAKFMELDLV